MKEEGGNFTFSARAFKNPTQILTVLATLMGCASSKDTAASGAIGTGDVKLVANLAPSPTKLSPASLKRQAAEAKAAEAKAAEAAEAAKEEAAKVMAATRLQAASRGKAGREIAENKKHACCNYRVNMKADNFGECLCGWMKASHSEDALATGLCKVADSALVSPGTLQRKFVQKEHAVCTRYEVNMGSINFGECKCGKPKAEHTAAALAAADTSNAANLTSPGTLQRKFLQKERAECSKYVVDMRASETAVCICGAPRSSHSVAALKGAADEGKANSKVVDDADVRKKFLQRERVECERYEVNLQSGEYGQCKNCGAARKEHTQTALAGAADAGKASARFVNSETVRAKFVQRDVVECASFALDLSEGVPFGTCTCGFPKAKHSEAAIRGAKRSSRSTVAAPAIVPTGSA